MCSGVTITVSFTYHDLNLFFFFFKLLEINVYLGKLVEMQCIQR